jgi:Ca-activated chloride channel family protein
MRRALATVGALTAALVLALGLGGGAPAWGLNVSLAQIDSSRLLLTQTVGAYVSVTDDQGNPVLGLPRGDFSVAESADGRQFQPMPITSFTPQAGGTQGITFLLLIDDSGSMYDTVAGTPTTDPALMRITLAREAVRTFLASMTNPADRVGLAYFNTAYHVLTPPVADRERVAALMEEISRPVAEQAYTELYASITLAARELAGVSGRKAIIVLSDGENYPYFVHSGRPSPVFGTRVFPYTDSILANQQDGITVYGISFGPEKDRNLQAIATETGGRLFDAANGQELATAYQTIHRQVAGEYLVGYRAGLAPAERKYVRVEVSAAAGSASATRFYFASTVLGLPVSRLTPLLVLPFLAAIALLWALSLLKLEQRRFQPSLEVLETHVGHPSTRVLPLTSSKTIIGATRAADLTIAGAPQVQAEHATILFDPKDRSYTVVGTKGQVLVNNQPVRMKKLEAGDVIDVGGAAVVFDPGNPDAARKAVEQKKTGKD